MRALKRLLGRLPSALPTDKAKLDAWIDDVIETYELPNIPGYRHALAQSLMHVAPDQAHVPKYLYGRAIKRSMANQTAYERMKEIESEMKKQAEAEKALIEATPPAEQTIEPIQDACIQATPD